MKTGILLLLLLPTIALAQNIALLDRNLKKPVVVTQALAATQLAHNLFPIYTTDLDSVIQLLEDLARRISNKDVPEEMMQVLPVGHSQFAITTEPKGNVAVYTIYLSTRIQNLGASLEVVEPKTGNRRTVQNLLLFLDYLKNNRPFIGK